MSNVNIDWIKENACRIATSYYQAEYGDVLIVDTEGHFWIEELSAPSHCECSIWLKCPGHNNIHLGDIDFQHVAEVMEISVDDAMELDNRDLVDYLDRTGEFYPWVDDLAAKTIDALTE